MDSTRPGVAERGLLGESLRVMTQLSARFPKAMMWAVVVFTCAALVATGSFIKFKTERADLLDPKADFHQRWLKYTSAFGSTSDVVVVVEADSPDTIAQILEDLGKRVQQESTLFSNVLYKVADGRMRQKGLHYYTPPQLQAGLHRLDAFTPVLQGRIDGSRVDVVFQRLNSQLDTSQGTPDATRVHDALEEIELLASSMSTYLDSPGDFRNPWPEILAVSPRAQAEARAPAYLMNDERTMGFLCAVPTEVSSDFLGGSRSIDRIREIVHEVSRDYNGATIGVTGIPVLEQDEMRHSQADMTLASLISFVGAGILLIIGFRSLRHPFLSLIMLGIGTAWSFGYATVTVGHLNILSLSFAAILIGLGTDFSIHFLARYLEYRKQGMDLEEALLESSATIGPSIVTGALTTSLAFFCATFTQFVGISELGIIAGGGILLCALSTFLVLPALVALCDYGRDVRSLPQPFKGRMLQFVTNRFAGTTAIVTVLLVLGLGSQIFSFSKQGVALRLQYDYNLLNLQAQGTESVEIQKRLFEKSANSLLFAVSVADSPEEARALRQKFEALPTVARVEDLASRLPAYASGETQRLVSAYRSRLSRLPQVPRQAMQPNPAQVGRAIETMHRTLKAQPHRNGQAVADHLDAFLTRFEKLTLGQQTAFLTAYQQGMTMSLLGQLNALAAASDPDPVRLSDLPPALKSRFVSAENQWLLQVYPKEQIWDVEPLLRFVKDVRSVDPEATGTPLHNYEAAGQIRTSYETAALYALGAILLTLLLDFLGTEHKLLTLMPPLIVVAFAGMMLEARGGTLNVPLLLCGYVVMAIAIAAVLDMRHLRDVGLAMLPPIAGLGMTLGILGLMNVSLNPANLIILPLILGIGVDNGVHLVHDYRRQTPASYRTSSSTINAIVLTSLTAIVGFGSLMVADHRGLYSAGMVLCIGISCALFLSLTTVPALLSLIARDEARMASGGAQSVRVPRESREDRTEQQARRRAA